MRETLEQSLSKFLEAERNADKRCAFTNEERGQREYFIARIQAHLDSISSAPRFCFRCDCDGHWYLIPADRAAEFDRLEPLSAQYWRTADYNNAELREAVNSFGDFGPMMISGRVEHYIFESPLDTHRDQSIIATIKAFKSLSARVSDLMGKTKSALDEVLQ